MLWATALFQHLVWCRLRKQKGLVSCVRNGGGGAIRGVVGPSCPLSSCEGAGTRQVFKITWCSHCWGLPLVGCWVGGGAEADPLVLRKQTVSCVIGLSRGMSLLGAPGTGPAGGHAHRVWTDCPLHTRIILEDPKRPVLFIHLNSLF